MISVCVGSACHLRGSHQIVEILKEILPDEAIQLRGVFCRNQCSWDGVAVWVGERMLRVRPENARQLLLQEIQGEGIG